MLPSPGTAAETNGCCLRPQLGFRAGWEGKKQHKMCCAALTSKLPPPNHLDEHNPNGEVCYREVCCAG